MGSIVGEMYLGSLLALLLSDPLTKLLTEITDNYFDDKQKLIIISSRFDYIHEIEGFLMTINENPIEIINGFLFERRKSKSEGFVIQFCFVFELEYYFSRIAINQFQKFILIAKCEHVNPSTVAKTLWNDYLSDFLIITKDMELFTWFPFSTGNCGDNFTLLKAKKNDLFPINKINNLHKCPIKVKFQYIAPFVMNERDGALIEMINTLGRLYNFTPIHNIHSGKNDVIDFEYMFDGLKNRSDDLSLPLDSLSVFRNLLFDYTGYYLVDPDCLCIRTPRKISKLSKLAELIFSQFYYTIYAMIIHVLVTFLFGKVLRAKERFNSFVNIYHSYVRVILGAGSYIMPISVTLRILFAAWLLYALVFSTQYTSILFQRFKEPVYELEMFNEKLDNATKFVPIYFDRQIMPLLKQNTTHLANMFQICEDPIECSAKVINGGPYMSFMKRLVVDYNVYRFVDEHRTVLLNCYKSTHSMNYLMIYMRNNYFMKNILSKAIRHMVASGLIINKFDQLIHKNKIKDAVAWEVFVAEEGMTGILHFEDFLIIFLYILIALSIALVVFLLEILHYRYKNVVNCSTRLHVGHSV